MAARRPQLGLALLALSSRVARAAEPSWAAELARQQCTVVLPSPSPPPGAGRRPRRRRSRSFARLLGFGSPDDGEGFAAFKLPKLGLAEAMVYCFFVMFAGLILAANI
jgi:hypothetical protein